MIWMALLLAAALVYACLRQGAALDLHNLAWRLGLIVVLLAGVAYQVYWDGIWSAAHGRAFEDHLPFAHFLISLLAGMLLLFTLRGWRRAAGPGFLLLGTIVTTLALVRGWDVSAVDVTERRPWWCARAAGATRLGKITTDWVLLAVNSLISQRVSRSRSTLRKDRRLTAVGAAMRW